MRATALFLLPLCEICWGLRSTLSHAQLRPTSLRHGHGAAGDRALVGARAEDHDRRRGVRLSAASASTARASPYSLPAWALDELDARSLVVLPGFAPPHVTAALRHDALTLSRCDGAVSDAGVHAAAVGSAADAAATRAHRACRHCWLRAADGGVRGSGGGDGAQRQYAAASPARAAAAQFTALLTRALGSQLSALPQFSPEEEREDSALRGAAMTATPAWARSPLQPQRAEVRSRTER